MITRTFDEALIKRAIGSYEIQGLDLDDWLQWSDEKTVALTNGSDVSLLQREYPGVYYGHWFYHSRGKEAKAVAVEMLSYAFENYPIEIIMGFIGLENLRSRWMARQVGFRSQGPVFWRGKNLEFFLLTKRDFLDV